MCGTRELPPRYVLRFDDHADLGLLVLPCTFFDPLWLADPPWRGGP
jgi:hypothetical protein